MKLKLAALIAACCVLPPAVAADAGYAIRLMTPETALKAALAGQAACRKAGFQVAIAVVDRTGQVQVVLRDRFAGMHTPEAAVDKAWTAASFKMDTTALAKATGAATASSGIRQMSRVLAVGGGMLVEAGGAPYGAIGVSGAPSGENDDMCARAAIDAVIDDLNL
ncbi:heme-binding protein [Massilia sp. GCM10020059]|uniref:Heme-binding protein n=1 Tax=Massilia agrisoli TaxID=2892444 RepID=A0ABS8IQT5_9BURK|nr:heme-binding protein [Massilia agrisoli]MCC6070997.1 heme-binding protein [Massilia agrisoli]